MLTLPLSFIQFAETTGSVESVLLQYGIAGVVIIGMAVVIRTLYNDNKMLQTKLDAEKDGRRLDATETIDKISDPLSSISQTVSYIHDKLVISKRGNKS